MGLKLMRKISLVLVFALFGSILPLGIAYSSGVSEPAGTFDKDGNRFIDLFDIIKLAKENPMDIPQAMSFYGEEIDEESLVGYKGIVRLRAENEDYIETYDADICFCGEDPKEGKWKFVVHQETVPKFLGGSHHVRDATIRIDPNYDYPNFDFEFFPEDPPTALVANLGPNRYQSLVFCQVCRLLVI